MTLRFLHFSDIHFGQERENGEWDAYPDVRAEALADIRRVITDGLIKGPAQAVLVTGDIAQAGLESEFKAASSWIDEVIDLAGAPSLSMRSIPGNHDVNLTRLNSQGLQTHQLLREASVDNAYAFLSSLSGNGSNAIADKFIDYRGFAHAYGSDFTSDTNPMNVAFYDMENGPGIRLIGFSTVLISDRKDIEGKLLLGANQYQVSREPGYEDIVMMHHPIPWLKDGGRASVYLNSRARMLLTGHEHHPQLNMIEHDNGFQQLRLAAGALTPPGAGPGYWYSYNWIEFDWLPAQAGKSQLQVTVYPRAWQPADTRFGADKDRLSSGECHRIVLSCEPQAAAVGLSQAPVPPLVSAAIADVPIEPQVDEVDLGLPETDVVPAQVEDTESFAELRFLFWRYLSRDQRIDALIKVQLLTERARARLPSFMEQEAFDEAADDTSIISELWELTMLHVPGEHRRANPFKAVT